LSNKAEKRLLKRIEELERQLKQNQEFQKPQNKIPIYSFSRIQRDDLEQLVDIERKLGQDKFDFWFNFKAEISDETNVFLQNLIEKNRELINLYHEEDLKINFIAPLITKVDFFMLKNNIRNFYNEKLVYKTDKFIFSGTTDFVVSKGLVRSIKPYFFIQEFKKGKVNRDPEPQLLAELISAIELNNEKSMRGAYIVGAIWNFVILEKLGKDKYQYFVSQNFDSTKIGDLKDIYRNLVFVKNEIIEMIKKPNKDLK
jgi:hypothetical protein